MQRRNPGVAGSAKPAARESENKRKGSKGNITMSQQRATGHGGAEGIICRVVQLRMSAKSGYPDIRISGADM
eukprot:167641-Chlamydomonas_euryale.AAC.1